MKLFTSATLVTLLATTSGLARTCILEPDCEGATACSADEMTLDWSELDAGTLVMNGNRYHVTRSESDHTPVPVNKDAVTVVAVPTIESISMRGKTGMGNLFPAEENGQVSLSFIGALKPGEYMEYSEVWRGMYWFSGRCEGLF